MERSNLASFRNRVVTLTVAAASLIAIAGCSGQPLSTREKGTLAGGAIGAGGGAAVGHPLAGAAIGGVVGAGTGMAIGNSLQNNENRQRYGE